MPKRKCSSLSNEDDDIKVVGKLFHGLKEIKKSAKKAKAFETQKIVKRLKASGEKNSAKSALEAELNALKALDHDRIGTLALKTKLKKDKRLSSNPSIQSAISKIFAPDIARTSEGVAAKLESRLLSSKLLSKAVNLVISSLYSALKQGEDGDGGDDTSSHSNEAHLVDLTAVVNQPVTSEASEDDSGDSEDDTSGTSDSVENDEPFQRSTPTLPKNFRSPLDRTSHSPRLPDDASQSMGIESAFLPSLSNGFIPGGSDTDLSDGEASATAGIRKNRRGQRARRAIWEKKYGKGAKHLQNREESGSIHDTRTFKKHFKGPQANSRPQHHDPSKQHSRAQKVDAALREHTSPSHLRKSGAVDVRPLHPSWIAKMRMKEVSSAAIVAPQGKRIKFDD